jgi:hypothetical protein
MIGHALAAARQAEEELMSSLTRRELSFLSLAAAALDTAAVSYLLPDQIKWLPPSPASAQNTLLAGDP